MIKRIVPILMISVVLVMIFLVAYRGRVEIFQSIKRDPPLKKTQEKMKIVINEEKLEINGRKIIGLPPGREKQFLQKLNVANRPNEEWKTGLERSLRAQGGEKLRDLKMDKVDSFVWVQDDIALFVESVLVQVKNESNVNIKFRVLVDAQTGKILNNWDRPVIDIFDPKSEYKIPIDSRYHSE
jgi:hypothetical protein